MITTRTESVAPIAASNGSETAEQIDPVALECFQIMTKAIEGLKRPQNTSSEWLEFVRAGNEGWQRARILKVHGIKSVKKVHDLFARVVKKTGKEASIQEADFRKAEVILKSKPRPSSQAKGPHNIGKKRGPYSMDKKKREPSASFTDGFIDGFAGQLRAFHNSISELELKISILQNTEIDLLGKYYGEASEMTLSFHKIAEEYRAYMLSGNALLEKRHIDTASRAILKDIQKVTVRLSQVQGALSAKKNDQRTLWQQMQAHSSPLSLSQGTPSQNIIPDVEPENANWADEILNFSD
jgi:hypothetical protein